MAGKLTAARRRMDQTPPLNIVVINFGAGGLWHYASSLVNHVALHPAVDKISLITSSHNDTSWVQPHAKIELHTFKAPHSLLAFLRWCTNVDEQRRLRSFIRQRQPQVIHMADSYPVYMLHQRFIKKYPIVFTQHDPLPHSGERYATITRFIQKKQQAMSDRVIVHGQVLKQQLLQNSAVLPHKIVSLPMGAHHMFRQPHQANINHIHDSVLFFGRIVKYKGLDTLLTSLERLQAKKIPFHFTLAGQGNLDAYAQQLSSLNHTHIDNRYIPDDKVNYYLQRSDVVVFPYHEATQSGAVTAAMAAGCAIIASAVGALPEILRHNDNAWLIEPGNPQVLAEAIQRLLNDPALRARLAHNAYRTATTDLAWSRIADQHVAIYQEIQ